MRGDPRLQKASDLIIMSVRDLQFVRLMDKTEFREYLGEHAPSGSVIESFAKAFVARNSSAHLLAVLIEEGFVDVNLGFREDFVNHRIYGAKDRWTLLHLAAFEDAVDIARTLLDLGASVDASSGESYGQTPLHGAVSAEMADLLIKRGGATVDCRDRFGATPLFRAVVDGVALGDRVARLALIGRLLEVGADPSIPRPWPAGNPLAGTAPLTMTDAISRKTDEYSKKVLGLMKSTSS